MPSQVPTDRPSINYFERAFAIVVGEEGGWSNDPDDPGNWTGGDVNEGELKGTKYGVSAASYPDLDIEHLSKFDAHAIYVRDFWDPAHCNDVPWDLALVIFDTAVNNGVSAAIHFVQQAADVPQDGDWGDQTKAAVEGTLHADPDGTATAAEILAQRLIADIRAGNWSRYGLGWSRRICNLPYKAR